jgi:hypothetical protein
MSITRKYIKTAYERQRVTNRLHMPVLLQKRIMGGANNKSHTSSNASTRPAHFDKENSHPSLNKDRSKNSLSGNSNLCENLTTTNIIYSNNKRMIQYPLTIESLD